MAKKQICIIGAGFSGLTAIKCCLDEGLNPVCFEKNHDIGGMWRYQEDEREEACVYRSTIINTSKEMMAFSDFPIPKEFANFMHNKKLMEYARLYAKEFNLLNYIQFSTSVISCEPTEDFKKTGQWNVKTKQQDGKEHGSIFDGILVCIGHHANPHYPRESFPGIHKFKGTTMHSHSYRHHKSFENKRVVVIGIGNSGGDIAVELSKHAEQVYLSTRRGAWVMHRVGDEGKPLDYQFSNRFLSIIQKFLPSSMTNAGAEAILNKRFDHAKYGLKPAHRATSQHGMVNDSLPNCIISGGVTIKGNVTRFTENGVIFEDGSYKEIDAVVFATGYSFSFPFLDKSILKVTNNQCRLYKYMWPSHLERGTMAVIGNVQPLGAINPISEIQCRWATRVFKGDTKLPSAALMNMDVDNKISEMEKSFYKSQRHTIQVHYVYFMDEIAEQIGVKPRIIKWFLTDFKLGMQLLFGGCTPFHYRLDGPGAWAKARETIMTQEDRIYYPLATRQVAISKPSNHSWLLASIVVLFLCYLLLRMM